MVKFKKGDLVYDIRYGVGRITDSDSNIVTLDVKFQTIERHGCYCKDGRDISHASSPPILWTFKEAKEKGYGPQLEPAMCYQLKVYFTKSKDNPKRAHLNMRDKDWGGWPRELIDKHGTLTFVGDII